MSSVKRVFWMVWNPTGNAPRVRHNTPDSAEAEATRLARENPANEFVVLEAKASFQVNTVTRTEFDSDIPF